MRWDGPSGIFRNTPGVLRVTTGSLRSILHQIPSRRCDAFPHYAYIRDQLERKGQIIGGNDLLIAAIAITNGLTLLTHNSNEFERVPGLSVEDWVRSGP